MLMYQPLSLHFRVSGIFFFSCITSKSGPLTWCVSQFHWKNCSPAFSLFCVSDNRPTHPSMYCTSSSICIWLCFVSPCCQLSFRVVLLVALDKCLIRFLGRLTIVCESPSLYLIYIFFWTILKEAFSMSADNYWITHKLRRQWTCFHLLWSIACDMESSSNIYEFNYLWFPISATSKTWQMRGIFCSSLSFLPLYMWFY